MERDERLRVPRRVTIVGEVDPERLVFVDEMGANISLCPLYAWSPKGERAHVGVPRNLKARTPPCWRAWVSKGWGTA